MPLCGVPVKEGTMPKHCVWIAALVMAACISLGLAQQSAHIIFYNGKVLTVDPNSSIAQAVAVRGNRITAVGSNDEVLRLAGSNTLRIDLKGKTMTPGLINTHVHLESPGGYASELTFAQRNQYPLNFANVSTTDDVVKQIKDIIAAFPFEPGQWIYFPTNPRGHHAKLLYDELNASVLDEAAPNNPIVLSIGVPAHNVSLVNGVALKEMWRKYGDFIETYGRYWIDGLGRPEGHVEAPTSRIIWEDDEFGLGPPPEHVGPLYRKILEEYSAQGVTGLSGGLHTSTVRAYQWLDSRGQMPLRYGYGVLRAFIPGSDMTRYQMGAGTDNVFITSVSSRAVDGAGARMCISLERDSVAVGAATAAAGQTASLMGLSSVSQWWPRGQCSLDIEYGGASKGARVKANYFMDWYNTVSQNGLRSANVHVSGDDSHARMISEFERLDQIRPGSVEGWAMDHCNLIDPRDIPRAARLGLMWSCSPGNAVSEQVATAFGEQVLNTYAAPIKTMVDAGINVSLEGEGAGSFWGALELAITRKDEEGKVWGAKERVDRTTALRIATQNGANYMLKGDQLGSIEPGKFADLVVIDHDYMSIPEDDISEIRSLMTLLGGKFIFLHTDFASEYNLRPTGAVISTLEELENRRPRQFGGN